MSADTVSSLFPGRPIRPLPKRRLRERLSQEAADSIRYPLTPQSVAPLFPYPYPLREEEQTPSSRQSRGGPSELEPGQARRNDPGAESDDEDAALKQGVATRSGADPSGRPGLLPPKSEQQGRHANSHLPLSATSSVDGYDSFENTNNKKKRKIPTAQDSALIGIHIINDLNSGAASLAAAAQSAESHALSLTPSPTPYYGSGNFASGTQNVAGPGRGRYGRPRSGRSPLRPLSDSTNNWAGRNGKLRPNQWASGSSENTGIISTAIANAEKLAPRQGQENISLLHQQLITKRSPASAQFTFTCDSQVPGTLAWPGPDFKIAPQAHQPSAARQVKENWPRTPQSSQGGHAASAMPPAADMAPKEAASKGGDGGQHQTVPTQKRTRRSLAKECNSAAKARRQQAQLYNKRHPPKPEEIWICHFCEYESIFGHPPEALVRQYEIKDRKQRQLEQQRRAQWERMKKGKHKGKKNGKPPAKNNSAAQDPNQPAGHGTAMNGNYSQGTQSEEYYDEEEYEDEEYDPDEELPPEGGMDPLGRHDHLPPHTCCNSAGHIHSSYHSETHHFSVGGRSSGHGGGAA